MGFFDFLKPKQQKKIEEPHILNIPVFCDHCGLSKMIHYAAGGADEHGALYGNHQYCPDGTMGMFRDIPIRIKQKRKKKIK